MISIIHQGPVIKEAYDMNTEEAHIYFNTVKEWVAKQSESLKELDLKARHYNNQALAFRTILKFIESEKIIRNLKEHVTLTLINPVYKETMLPLHLSTQYIKKPGE